MKEASNIILERSFPIMKMIQFYFDHEFINNFETSVLVISLILLSSIKMLFNKNIVFEKFSEIRKRNNNTFFLCITIRTTNNGSWKIEYFVYIIS